ncbi:MAG: carbohydrate ABC transporter permease [Lachnospiraceae bacterium]|nr:carbohydrate ABC transporter permease [Lachnospiraceae bacterium]
MKTLLLLLAVTAVVLIVISVLHPIGKKISLYLILIAIALIMLLPFYMMFVMSTLKTNEIYSFPPIVTFGSNLIENFKNMTAAVNLPRAFLNSCIVTFSYTILVLFFCSMGGYAFSVYDFPGKNMLFTILLGTMMIPATAGMIPWFIMMSKFGWVNDFKALIIPGCANAFGIFWMRQYCQNNVPKALMEAARIDGCSEWTIFFRVIAPILKPAYASLGIMNFVNQWNEFTQALIILRKEKMYTLPLLLRSMVSDRGTDYGAMMLASTCAVLPLLICFLCASKFFMDGLTAGAVKE